MAFGYGNRSCPGVDLTQMELTTLFGALASVFDITAKEGQPLPWYEVNPYVITMTQPFPVNIKARSEAKRQFIIDGAPEPGYWLKEKESEKNTRWDLVRPQDGSPWTWGGLAPPYHAPATPKVYPEGA